MVFLELVYVYIIMFKIIICLCIFKLFNDIFNELVGGIFYGYIYRLSDEIYLIGLGYIKFNFCKSIFSVG